MSKYTMMIKSLKLYPLAIIVAFAFLLTTICGIFINFTSVPYWDMWGGYLDFYLQVLNKNYAVWWQQHNEHRIVFSKFLFWLDLKYFSGRSIFLIAMNLLFMTSTWCALFIYARILLDHLWNKSFAYVTASILLMISFSWMQHENITWAFQSSFFCAFVFPMLSFLLLAKYEYSRHYPQKSSLTTVYFIGSIFFGTLSSFTLACGILAMPFLAIMSITLKQPKKIICTFLSTSVFIILVYSHNYVTPIHHSSLFNSIFYHTTETIHYVITYLGNPFYYITESLVISSITGAIFMIGFLYSLYAWLRAKNKNPFYVSSLIFILYIITTALLTAGGRLKFGVEQATSSRYTTPMLMAWATLAILLLSTLRKSTEVRILLFLLTITLYIFLLIPQSDIYINRHAYIATTHNKETAALALQLNIKDDNITSILYPKPEMLTDLMTQAQKNGISLFATQPTLKSYLKQDASLFHLHHCYVTIHSTVTFKDDPSALRINGDLTNYESKKNPKYLFFVSHTGKIIGIATVAKNPLSKNNLLGKKEVPAGFQGYIFGKENPVNVLC